MTAVLFSGVAVYLTVCGLIMAFRPGAISMAVGADLLGGLETAGPHMFLLLGAVAAAIGLGIWRRNNWARRAAIIAALLGMVLLVPTVSDAAASIRLPSLARSGLGVIIRVMVVWYLYQAPVRDAFARKNSSVEHTQVL